MTSSLTPRLTPRGHLQLAPDPDAPTLPPDLAVRLEAAFARGAGHGLLALGGTVGVALPPALAFFRGMGARYLTAVRSRPDAGSLRTLDPLSPPADLDLLLDAAPPMIGAEYLSAAVLRALWAELGEAFGAELVGSGEDLAAFLHRLDPAWNLVGRVHFHLAENRKDDAAPFAFLATYTPELAATGRARHLPLGQALREYAGAANRDRLLSLLLPVQRGAERCAWLKALVDSGELFHPLRWSPAEAFRLLRDVPVLEEAGVVVRMPAGWVAGRPSRPVAQASVGARPPSALGRDALLDFRLDVTLDGAALTRKEIETLLAGTDGLAMLRGQWVEVDRERLSRMLDRFRAVEQVAGRDGLTFAEALRQLAGADIAGEAAERPDPDWSKVVAGPWLAETLARLRSPESEAGDPLAGIGLQATLRPYQQAGVKWLQLLSRLGLGALLADDMGLGKTIQVLALLSSLKREGGGDRPSLLVAPASLLANWAAEAERFTPGLRVAIAHASAGARGGDLAGADLVVTSYGALLRDPAFARKAWNLLILDEAQAVKNPGAKQSKAVKALEARARIALTGTPVENRLSDLWSIFDFLNPGLLGSAKQFTAFSRKLPERPDGYRPLRELIRPYLLRRLKTDPSVIADLPEKTEVKAYCPLARKQAALYSQAVDDLAVALDDASGIRRKGVVLAALMRFKQICNHPSQWLGDGAWAEGDSGKLGRLRELAEEIASRQEKTLVFTQFRETTGPLAAFLAGVFCREGLVLHGGTPVKRRRELVESFQAEDGPPFFVISLKAGGSGLNLTAASHVIHFDRWWNPAVENQATDRAFRIGQKRNVLVHKLVCRGTVEERIDELIEGKRRLSGELLEGGAEPLLTELSDDELLSLVRLDLATATSE